MCDFDFLLFNTENNKENIQFNLNGLNDHLSFDNNKNIVLNLINKENLDFFIFKSSLYNLDNFYDVDNYASINDLSNHITNKYSISYICVNNEKEISFINKKIPAHRFVFIGIFDSDIINLINFKLVNKLEILLDNIRVYDSSLNDFIKENKIIPINSLIDNPEILNFFYMSIKNNKYHNKTIVKDVNNNIICSNIEMNINTIFIDSINQWKEKTYKINSKSNLINIVSYILFKTEKFVVSKNNDRNNKFIISFEELENILVAYDFDVNSQQLKLFFKEFNYIFSNYNNEDEYYYVKNSIFVSIFCYDYLINKHKENLENVINELFIGDHLLLNSDQIINIIYIYNDLSNIKKQLKLKLRIDFLFFLIQHIQINGLEVIPDKNFMENLKNKLNIIKNIPYIYHYKLENVIYYKNHHIIPRYIKIKQSLIDYIFNPNRLILKNIFHMDTYLSYQYFIFNNIIKLISKKTLNDNEIIKLLNYFIKYNTNNNKFFEAFYNSNIIIEFDFSLFKELRNLQEYYKPYSLNFNDFNDYYKEEKNDLFFHKLFIKDNIFDLYDSYHSNNFHYLNIFNKLKNKNFNLTSILTKEQQKKYYNNLSKLPKNFEEFLNIFDEIDKNECKSDWFIENNFNYNTTGQSKPKDENHINKNISNLLKNKYQIDNTIESENNDKTRTDIKLSNGCHIIIECKGEWNTSLIYNDSIKEYPCVTQLCKYLLNNNIKYGVLLIYFFEGKEITNDLKNLEPLKKYIDEINKDKELNIQIKTLYFKNKVLFLSEQKLKNIFNFITNNKFSKTNLKREMEIESTHAQSITNLLENNNLTENSGSQLKLISNHNLDENKFVKLYNKNN